MKFIKPCHFCRLYKNTKLKGVSKHAYLFLNNMNILQHVRHCPRLAVRLPCFDSVMKTYVHWPPPPTDVSIVYNLLLCRDFYNHNFCDHDTHFTSYVVAELYFFVVVGLIVIFLPMALMYQSRGSNFNFCLCLLLRSSSQYRCLLYSTGRCV